MPFLHKVVVVCFLFLVVGSLPLFAQCPPPDPIATGDASCTPKSFTLSAFNSTDTYNWYDAAGTLVSQGDFYTTPVISVTTTYYVTSYDSGNNCESEKIAVQLVILPDTGTPSVYGSDQWFAYCFNGINWTTYKGFYVDNNLGINTAALWDPLLSPNNGTPQVAGYIGCPVTIDNHSISYKRQGFPPDVYRIDITEQNDDFSLLIDGVEVIRRVSYGQVYPAVWTGTLDANSQVEYKWLDRGGKSSATVNFVATGVPTDLYAGRITNNQA
ncbi:MAG: large protein [Chitinophagaceae bacterium]|nr:large protein [Chitinophagaceae bacterium]